MTPELNKGILNITELERVKLLPSQMAPPDTIPVRKYRENTRVSFVYYNFRKNRKKGNKVS